MPRQSLPFSEIQAQFSAMVQHAAVRQSAQQSRLNHTHFLLQTGLPQQLLAPCEIAPLLYEVCI